MDTITNGDATMVGITTTGALCMCCMGCSVDIPRSGRCRQPHHGGGRPGPQGQRAPQPGPQGPYRGPPMGAGPPKPYQGQRQPVHARADVRGVPRQGGAPPPQQQRGYQPAAGGYGGGYGACRGSGVVVRQVLRHVVAQGRLALGRVQGSQVLRRLAHRVAMVHHQAVRYAMVWSTRGHTAGREWGRHRQGIGGVRLAHIKAVLNGTASGVD